MTNPMTKEQAVAAIQKMADAIVGVVQEMSPDGVPAGSLYSAMMAHGASLAQFEAFMAALVGAGRLTKRGQLYFAT